jgi:hypothetical protein
MVAQDTLVRPLPFGAQWNNVRIGIRGRFTGAPVPATGAMPFFFGLDSSGATYGFGNQFETDPAGARFIGLQVTNGMAAGTSSLHYDGNAAGNLIVERFESTVDFSTQLPASPRFSSSNTDVTVIMLEFTRGFTDVSVTAIYQNATSAVSTATFDAAMAAGNMTDALALLGATYSASTHTVTGAIARDANGPLDRICISAATGANYDPLNENVPLIQNISVRRLY